MNKIKFFILSILLTLIMTSCIRESLSNTIKYSVIDTTSSSNDFFMVMSIIS